MTNLPNINIQFMRAVAAIAVVFYHTSVHFFVVGGEKTGNIFSFMSQIGFIGVDIFFVISGYIMWISTKKLKGKRGVISFVFSRLTRIYPIYWFFLLFMLYFYHKSLYNFDSIGSLFLTFHSSNKLLLQVAWTLQYELYFYAIFAFLLFLPRKYLLLIFSSLFLIILTIQTYAIITIDLYASNVYNGASTFYTFWASPFILEFLFGVAIGYYFDNYHIKHIVIPIILSFIFLIGAFYYQEILIHTTLAEGYYLPQRVLLLGMSSLFLIATMVELHYRKIIIFPVFSTIVGNASYSIYLSHTIVLLFLYTIGIRDAIANYGNHQLWLILGIVIFIIISTTLFYQWIEKPLLNYFHTLRMKLLSYIKF